MNRRRAALGVWVGRLAGRCWPRRAATPRRSTARGAAARQGSAATVPGRARAALPGAAGGQAAPPPLSRVGSPAATRARPGPPHLAPLSSPAATSRLWAAQARARALGAWHAAHIGPPSWIPPLPPRRRQVCGQPGAAGLRLRRPHHQAVAPGALRRPIRLVFHRRLESGAVHGRPDWLVVGASIRHPHAHPTHLPPTPTALPGGRRPRVRALPPPTLIHLRPPLRSTPIHAHQRVCLQAGDAYECAHTFTEQAGEVVSVCVHPRWAPGPRLALLCFRSGWLAVVATVSAESGRARWRRFVCAPGGPAGGTGGCRAERRERGNPLARLLPALVAPARLRACSCAPGAPVIQPRTCLAPPSCRSHGFQATAALPPTHWMPCALPTTLHALPSPPHCSHDFLVTAAGDGSWALYDVAAAACVTQVRLRHPGARCRGAPAAVRRLAHSVQPRAPATLQRALLPHAVTCARRAARIAGPAGGGRGGGCRLLVRGAAPRRTHPVHGCAARSPPAPSSRRPSARLAAPAGSPGPAARPRPARGPRACLPGRPPADPLPLQPRLPTRFRSSLACRPASAPPSHHPRSPAGTEDAAVRIWETRTSKVGASPTNPIQSVNAPP